VAKAADWRRYQYLVVIEVDPVTASRDLGCLVFLQAHGRPEHPLDDSIALRIFDWIGEDRRSEGFSRQISAWCQLMTEEDVVASTSAHSSCPQTNGQNKGCAVLQAWVGTTYSKFIPQADQSPATAESAACLWRGDHRIRGCPQTSRSAVIDHRLS